MGEGQKFPQQLIFENVSPATRLLEKRRQMYEVQDALEAQKARFAKDEEQFKKREEALRAKDLQLQHQLIKFNKFLQDNEAKRRRAETRSSDEAAQIKQKDEEIEKLEEQLEESRRQCEELEEEVKRNMKYEEFLERAKESSDEFSEIQDLLTRYETLEVAHRDLVKSQLTFDQKNEEERAAFQQFQKDSANEILGFTTKTASLQSELEQMETLRQHLELEADEVTQGDSVQSLNLGNIIMSVENLYLRCTTQRPNIQHASELEPGKDRDDDKADEEDSPAEKAERAIKQLGVIQNYLRDFKEIVAGIRKPLEQRLQAGDDGKLPEPEWVPVTKAGSSEGTGQNSGSRQIKQPDVSARIG